MANVKNSTFNKRLHGFDLSKTIQNDEKCKREFILHGYDQFASLNFSYLNFNLYRS